MASLEMNVGPGALLLAAWLYLAGGGAALTAFFTAVLAHELGHLLAILTTGARISRLRITAMGPVIEYAGVLSKGQEALITAAGPLSGALFSGAAFLTGTPYFRYAGLVAALGTAFNLLPAYPMDGGRLARLLLETSMPEEAAAKCMRFLGALTAAGVIATGIMWHAPAIIAAGMLLLASAFKLR